MTLQDCDFPSSSSIEARLLDDSLPTGRNQGRILVADDDLVSRSMLIDILGHWGYEATVATDGEQAWSVLKADDPPRLAILDWVMPGLDGPQICQMVRREFADRYIYILMVSARRGNDDIILGLESGADDYIAKPYNPLELRARLIAGKRIIELQERLISAREALRRQATFDATTGLLNRRAIMEFLDRELARAKRENSPVGIVLSDIDHFKSINDVHGHLAGDKTLRKIARKLKAAVRPYDAVGRYGGEEFLSILPGCDLINACTLAERLRVGIAGEPIYHEFNPITVTSSFGVASFDPTRPLDAHALIQAADMALYSAKRNGRNKVEAATSNDTRV